MNPASKTDFYISLSASDSATAFPLNTATLFTTILPKRIPLTGKWSCALAGAFISGVNLRNTNLLVCCDLIEDSIVYGESLPLLRELYLKNAFTYANPTHLHYIAVKVQELYIIQIKIISDIVQNIRASKFTLHFKAL